jgi:hypothetical protein
MKKLILLSFALVFSVGSTFAYRSFFAIQINGYVDMWCDGSGGTCLPTVEVSNGSIAQSIESNELLSDNFKRST